MNLNYIPTLTKTTIALAAVLCWPIAAQISNGVPVCSRTYTLDADFDEGTLINLNHDPHDQLQLNSITAPLPFVNIACSARGTTVRIDVNTGAILGEYWTSPDGMGRDPSRTTVDRFGNVWVSNRGESGFSGGEFKGSLTRIGVILGGTRVNADGTPNPSGQYLKPPFLYSTCIDRDGDGLIKTSSGLGNILPWTNAGSADTDGGVTTAEDECIINYTRVAGTGTRTVAIDANNDVWTGGLGDLDHEKLSGVSGLPIPGTRFNVGCGGYGGLIDANGVLWSARGGGGLLRYDTTTPIPPAMGSVYACLDSTHGDYGLGIDPTTGHIWHTTLSFGRVVELDPLGNVLNTYGHGAPNAQGVAVDGSGNVWVAHSLFGATTVGHLRTDGTFVGNVNLPGGVGPTGVAVDANGKVWVANISTGNAMRIDPAAGPIGGGGFPIGAVDLTVDLDAAGNGPSGPYNYSDMTGFVSIGATAPSGSWTVLHNSTVAGTDWGTVCWNALTPPGSSVKVEVRAADNQTDLASKEFQEVQNCVSFCEQDIRGQYIEIRTTLSRLSNQNESPILYDLSVQCCNQPPVARCQSVTVCNDPGLCQADVLASQVDDGSYDPDGDPITLTLTPPGPYPVGETTVTLTVTDDQGASASCQTTVTVVDCEAPSVECTPTTNPSGENIPRAGTNPKSGRNPDGFYQLLASDNCDGANVKIYVKDSSEGPCGGTFAAGPFNPGDRVKLTQSPGQASSKPMAGVIVAHINTKGEPVLVVTDSAGNTTCHKCFVPPPPK